MRFSFSARHKIWWWLSLLGLFWLPACTAAPASPTATPTPQLTETVTLSPTRYTHPSAAFTLPVPEGWHVARETEVGVRFEPDANTPSTVRWIEMVAIYTGEPFEPDTLRTFGRQFAQDYCPVPGACEVYSTRFDKQTGTELAIGTRYERNGQDALHIRLNFRQTGSVVYALIAASTARGALRSLQDALWEHAQLAPAQAARLPLYGYRRDAVFPLHANHPETGPYLKVPIPLGWRLNQTSEVREDYYYSYALAMSPDGYFGLSVYIGHPSFSADTLRQDALDTLTSVFHFDPGAFTLAHQHRDMEGRWILNWEATPPGIQAATLAAIHDNELVLITGLAKPALWPMAESCFDKVLQTYRVDEQP